MKCEEARALIGPASDNELANAEAALIAGHINDCMECRSEWDNILQVREGIGTIISANQPDTDFEKRIVATVYKEERKRSRVSRNWATASIAAGVLISIAAFSAVKLQNAKNQEKISLTTTVAKTAQAASTVALEDLVASVGHHSTGPEDPAYIVDYIGKSNPESFSTKAGFKIHTVKLANYVLHGSDIVKTKEAKTLVRMCYTCLDRTEENCIDCYQAPSGMLSFGKTSTKVIALANGRTARFGTLDGQSAVMISNKNFDTVYVSPIASNKLLDLVAPNA